MLIIESNSISDVATRLFERQPLLTIFKFAIYTTCINTGKINLKPLSYRNLILLYVVFGDLRRIHLLDQTNVYILRVNVQTALFE